MAKTRFRVHSSILIWSVLMMSILFLFPDVTASAKGLDIYFMDMEGGAATLIMTPQQETVLIDCGTKRKDSRDLQRILNVTKLAGVTQINYLVTSHFHSDHFGNVLQLSEKLPIGRFYDHALMQPDQEYDKELYPDYLKASQGKRQVLKAGDLIPLKSGTTPLKLICVVSDGKVISAPVGNGSGPNPYCDVVPKPEDTSDNARSIGLLLTYGQFNFIDLGDLTWNIEHRLVCPYNPLGKVDLYMVTHHGLDLSSNPVLVKVIEPTVSVMCNGPRKGANPEVVALLKSVPGLKAAYQLHRNVEMSEKDNPEPRRIANWDEHCKGEFIKVSVEPSGRTFSVTVGEKGTTTQFMSK